MGIISKRNELSAFRRPYDTRVTLSRGGYTWMALKSLAS